ncbi:MAG: stage II sporulation protein P [Lachnospiraceae bacterium]|nr:stage II sporulation protein P [Lachnospiraceae bacterium]
MLKNTIPLAAYAEESSCRLTAESQREYEQLLRLEGMDEEYSDSMFYVDEEQERALRLENEKALAVQENVDTQQKPQRQIQYSLEEYREYDKLVSEFYAIDPTTMADESLLNLDALWNRDMTLKDNGDGPQILIYHTHSQEGFADSIAGDERTTVVGVGDYLQKLLEERYGLRVLHHKGQYDVEKRDYAYTKAAPALEQLLKDNPSIQVVIDLHRDEVREDTKLVTLINGKQTARFMFFNGLSRTRKTGEIPYLNNPYLQDNLAFAFQMQLACNEYYPGLTRKIYLKGYRYNMHYCPKTLLVELGAQTNTVEEAYHACEPLADVLAKVLLGEQ